MLVLSVSGMNCGSCAAKITRAIRELDAQARVQVDLKQAQVRVDSQAGVAEIAEAISELGYGVLPRP